MLMGTKDPAPLYPVGTEVTRRTPGLGLWGRVVRNPEGGDYAGFSGYVVEPDPSLNHHTNRWYIQADEVISVAEHQRNLAEHRVGSREWDVTNCERALKHAQEELRKAKLIRQDALDHQLEIERKYEGKI